MQAVVICQRRHIAVQPAQPDDPVLPRRREMQAVATRQRRHIAVQPAQPDGFELLLGPRQREVTNPVRSNRPAQSRPRRRTAVHLAQPDDPGLGDDAAMAAQTPVAVNGTPRRRDMQAIARAEYRRVVRAKRNQERYAHSVAD